MILRPLAQLLRRVLSVEALACPRCTSESQTVPMVVLGSSQSAPWIRAFEPISLIRPAQEPGGCRPGADRLFYWPLRPRWRS
jgi:hypothetical protein